MQGTYRSYRFSIVGNYALIDDIKNKLLSLGINISFRKTKSIYELYYFTTKHLFWKRSNNGL